jgi:putative transposase
VGFGGRLKEAGLLPSMGSVADAYDNALAEPFVATLKSELLHRRSWPTEERLRVAIFEYVEGFYDRKRRRHSAPGYLSPAEYEQGRMSEVTVA